MVCWKGTNPASSGHLTGQFVPPVRHSISLIHNLASEKVWRKHLHALARAPLGTSAPVLCQGQGWVTGLQAEPDHVHLMGVGQASPTQDWHVEAPTPGRHWRCGVTTGHPSASLLALLLTPRPQEDLETPSLPTAEPSAMWPSCGPEPGEPLGVVHPRPTRPGRATVGQEAQEALGPLGHSPCTRWLHSWRQAPGSRGRMALCLSRSPLASKAASYSAHQPQAD